MPLPEIQTARLTLRSFVESDIPELTQLIDDRRVAATTLRIPHPYTQRDAKEFINEIQHIGANFAIVIRDPNRLCGGIGLLIKEPHQHAELGYWIGVPYWGNGYATEAGRAVLAYGFEQLRLHRIFASHFKQNLASAKVLAKLGMRHEGCLREHILKWNQFIDLEMYGILREEWERVK